MKQVFSPWLVLSCKIVPNLKAEAEKLTSEAFPTADKALAGAVDILVEAFSEDNSLRSWTYNEIWNNSDITSTLKDQSLDEKETFKIYYDFEDKVSKLQGYRTLALNRGGETRRYQGSFKHNLEKMHRFYSARFKQKTTILRKLSTNLSRRKSFQPWSVVSVASWLKQQRMVRFNFSLKIFEAFS